jgi:purine-binding chemotaxis protein CheW
MTDFSSTERQYVIFRLGSEVFGLEINRVKEIIVYQDTTRIPGIGELIDGIINLRGHVIPIFNLRRKFGFPEVENTRSTRIVVVEAHDNTVGIVVDGVSEVLIIPGNIVEKPSSMITNVDANHISGIAKVEEKLVILLDLEKVIQSDLAQVI